MHHPRYRGCHSRYRTCLATRRQAYLLLARPCSRSPGAALASAVREDLSLAVRWLVPDAGHPSAHQAGRLRDRTDGGGLHRSIPEVSVILLVGHRGSATTLAVAGQAKSDDATAG